MGRVWLIACEDALCGLAREAVLRRDADARIAYVRSAAEAVRVGAECERGHVSVVLACGMETFDAATQDVARLGGELAGCEVLVLLVDCTTDAVASMLRSGANEVIAVDGERAAGSLPSRTPALRICMEHSDNGCEAGGAHYYRDDLVPVEELWPPLDEPEDEASAPVDEAPPAGAFSVSAGHGVAAPAPVVGLHELKEVAARAGQVASARGGGHRAPLVTVISGRGGVGKTTLVAALAACAARAGLRAAVLDLDLMSGDMPAVLGVEAFKGLEGLMVHEQGGSIADCDVEATAMRVGPGLTLWGPLAEGERAELFGGPVEQLIGALRDAADVIFADTSCYWGDAVAVAVGACDRCLVVGSGCETSASSAARAVALAMRLGVPATRMTSVFNRMGARGCGEEDALRFEMGASLRSRVHIADGGDQVSGLLSFGKLDALISGEGAFARDVRTCAGDLLGELGCPVAGRLDSAPAQKTAQAKFKLPWKRKGGAGS